MTLNATERKALTLSAFAASCICFAPGEIVSGGLLLVASALLWRWDERALKQEAAAARLASGGAVEGTPTARSGEPPAAAAE